MKNLSFLFVIALLLGLTSCQEDQKNIAISPNSILSFELIPGEHAIQYLLKKNDQILIDTSNLGIVANENYFSYLKYVSFEDHGMYADDYVLLNGKQAEINYEANQFTYTFKGDKEETLSIEVQLTDQSLAFRYKMSKQGGNELAITSELTSYNLNGEAMTWLQPMKIENANIIEDQHLIGELKNVGNEEGVAFEYPVLLQVDTNYILLAETNVHSQYCGSRLAKNLSGALEVMYPTVNERKPGEDLFPRINDELTSPWRILTIGKLEDVFTSTLATDLAEAIKAEMTEFIQPGFAVSYVPASEKEVNKVNAIKKYIDYASDMSFPYVSIDYYSIQIEELTQLIEYSTSKEVGLILDFSPDEEVEEKTSSVYDQLSTSESRDSILKSLHDLGIAGITLGYVGGYGQSIVAHYHDVFQDALKHQLLVNLNGQNIPAGWQRTYPNLMSLKSYSSSAFFAKNQISANQKANYCTLIPYTKNIYSPIDFSPLMLNSFPEDLERKTKDVFELALPIIFQSGIQTISEKPEGMENQIDDVKDFLENLPTSWDETKLIKGVPGQYIVLARRKGKNWYIAGINSTNYPMEAVLNLIEYGSGNRHIFVDLNGRIGSKMVIANLEELSVTLPSNGGFVYYSIN